MTAFEKRTYPRTFLAGAEDITLRMMTADDREALLSFARKLATHDLLFVTGMSSHVCSDQRARA
jgi:hypothetical protein